MYFIYISADLRKAHRPDKFIMEHVSYLEGLLKIAFAHLKFPINKNDFDGDNVENVADHCAKSSRKMVTRSTSRKNDVALESPENIQDEIEEPEENWKNKNKTGTSQSLLTLEKSRSVQRRSKYSILNPQNVDFCQRVPVLQNGYVGKGVQTFNTCAFDSIFSTYACLYQDYSMLRVAVDSQPSSSSFCKFIATVLQQKNLRKTDYAERNNILFSLAGQSSKVKQLTSLDCETGFAGIFSGMCKTNEILASSIMKRTCHDCESTFRMVRPLLPLDVYGLDIRNLQIWIIDPTMRAEHCPECKQPCDTEHHFNPVLALEVEPISPAAEEAIRIKDVTSQIVVNRQIYNLCGVIEATQGPRHFMCHVRRKNSCWEKYDDMAKNMTPSDLSKEIKIFMLFYISGTSSDGYLRYFAFSFYRPNPDFMVNGRTQAKSTENENADADEMFAIDRRAPERQMENENSEQHVNDSLPNEHQMEKCSGIVFHNKFWIRTISPTIFYRSISVRLAKMDMSKYQ